MHPGDLCICGHTREVHFGHDCSRVNCHCKDFALLDAAVDIYEALKALCNATDGGVYRPTQDLWNNAEAAIAKAKQ